MGKLINSEFYEYFLNLSLNGLYEDAGTSISDPRLTLFFHCHKPLIYFLIFPKDEH